MRRVWLLATALALGLALTAPAAAAPHLSKSRSREVSTLVARFVNDLVLRRDLADGWKISGPSMRGALTRKEWMSGRELPVQQLDVLNDPRTAWYAIWKSRTEIGLVISLRTGHGANAKIYGEKAVLAKRHGRWVVDSYYTDGIMRLGRGHSGSCVSSKCKVTGLSDYAAGGAGSAAPAKARIGGHWGLVAIFGIAGLPVLVLGVMGLVAYLRHRRARAAYLASRTS